MSTSELLLFSVFAVIFAAGAAIWYCLDKIKKTTSQLSASQQELQDERVAAAKTDEQLKYSGQNNDSLAAKNKLLTAELDQKNAEINTLTKEKIEVSEQLRYSKQSVGDQEKMKQQFESLAKEALGSNSLTFSKMSSEAISPLLKPVKEQLQGFSDRVEKLYQQDNRDRISIMEQVKQLSKLNVSLGEETRNLTQALKGDSRQRGEWGEIVLKRLLEEAGLSEGRDYILQQSMTDEAGQRKRPDAIINLPGDRQIIIDAKVSLLHWDAMLAAEDQAAHDRSLKAHCDSLRTHITDLGKKNYQDMATIKSLDFVLIFVPIEASLLAALQSEPDLYNAAWKQRIALVGPTTLFAVLNIVGNIWRLDHQGKNAIEIAKIASGIEKKFHGFIESLEGIGKGLNTAQNKYEQAHKQLVSGRDSLGSKLGKMSSTGGQSESLADGSSPQQQLSATDHLTPDNPPQE